MTTSAKQTSLFGEDKSTSSQEDSRVSHTQWREKEKAQKILDISGRKCLEQLESAGRPGLWGRTFLGLLIGQEGWYSSRCALTWKVKGTRYNRLYCQLAVSTLRTGEIGSGFWPTPMLPGNGGTNGKKKLSRLLKTPTAMDAEVSSGKKNPVSGDSGTLAQEIMSGYEPTMMKLGLLPTVRTSDMNHPGLHGTGGQDLRTVISLLPTPTATSDLKGGCIRKDEKRQNDTLAHAMHKATGGQTGKTSQLNPRFCLEMMGFPPNWTELPFLNGETNQSKPEEMP